MPNPDVIDIPVCDQYMDQKGNTIYIYVVATISRVIGDRELKFKYDTKLPPEANDDIKSYIEKWLAPYRADFDRQADQLEMQQVGEEQAIKVAIDMSKIVIDPKVDIAADNAAADIEPSI
jgi:hypothetical protein